MQMLVTHVNTFYASPKLNKKAIPHRSAFIRYNTDRKSVLWEGCSVVPHKLQLRNFMCYGEDVAPLVFDGIKVACLSGQNGAGKSALLDAITWALWGHARAKSDDDLIMLGRDEMEVVLEFMLDEHTYRVVRRRKRGKRSSTALEWHMQQRDGTWQQLTADTASETQRVINSTLHMEYDTFINSAFLLQGHADEFASRKPAERKQVLADILGLDEYANLEERARKQKSRLETDLDGVQAHIRRLESVVLERPLLEQRLADAQHTVTTLEDQLVGAEDDARELHEQVTYLRNQQAQLRTLGEQRRAAVVERQELVDSIADTQARVAEYDALIAQSAVIEAGVAQLAAARAALVDMDRRADTYNRLINEHTEWKSKLRGLRDRLEGDQARLHEQLAKLDEQLARHADLGMEHAQLRAWLDTFGSLRDEADRLRAEEDELRAQQAHARDLQTQLHGLEQIIALQRDQLRTTQQQQQRGVDDLQAQATQAAHIDADLLELDAERDRFDALARELVAARDAVQIAMQRDGELKADERRITHDGKDLKEKRKVLESGDGECPVCHNDLGVQGVHRIQQQYDEQLVALRDQLADVRSALADNKAALAQHQAAIDEREAVLVERAQLEARRAELRVRRMHAHDARNALVAAQQALADTAARLEQRQYAVGEQEQLRDAQTQLGALGDLHALQARFDAVRQQIKNAAQRQDEAAKIERQVAKLDAELAVLANVVGERPGIQQQLHEIERRLDQDDYGTDERREMARIKAEGQALGYDKERHHALRAEIDALDHWKDDAVRLDEATKQVGRERAVVRRTHAQLHRLDTELSRLADEIERLEVELANQMLVERQLRAAEQHRDGLRTTLSMAQNDQGRADAELRRCADAERQLAQEQEHAATLADERGVYAELVDAFGKKGVQAMLIETAIPEIEHVANELLGRMTDGQMHVTFETQRDTKAGNNTIETLDIRIGDTLGTRDYGMFSGGEAFRVNFALRIALSKLLARRAGASLKTLIIDEGFGTQDTQGRDRIVEAINAIAHDFERILVITHIQELKDLFPVHIEITKTGDGSRWAIA